MSWLVIVIFKIDKDRLYFVTYGTVGWADVFTRNEYKDIVLDSLEYCAEKKGLQVFAWCMMTNHLHLIIGTVGDNMEHILRAHKRHTSETIMAAILKNPRESRREWMTALFREAGKNNSNNTNHQFWQQHNKPTELYTKETIYKYLDYIHNNPVRAGFVEHPEDWLYSSARDYAGKKGLLKCLILIDKGIWDSTEA